MKKAMTVILLAIALSAAAADAPKHAPKKPATKKSAAAAPVKPAEFQSPATMCNGRFALCIKAPCGSTADANHNYPCTCILQDGWNMGPNSCDERAKQLTSTYSNAFNANSQTVSCPSSTNWAWCYGAKCEKDPTDPTGKRVVCRCPVKTSTALVLVNETKCTDAKGICATVWSAATPAESKFANDYYAYWMTEHGFKTLPPSEACPASQAKK